MNRISYIVSIILFITIFSGSPVFSSGDEEAGDKKITGILVRVDLKTQTVYVKENSRIVKFKSTSVLCEQFKNKINFEVDITYKICNNKSLQIVEMVISDNKAEINKPAVKPETSSKRKVKNSKKQ